MNRRGCLWFAAGLVLALMAGALIYITMQRAVEAPELVEEPPRVQVLVAAHDIPMHTVLTEADLAVREMAPENVPPNAMTQLVPDAEGKTDLQRATGKMTTVDMVAGEVILQQRLIAPDYVGPNVALVMDPDQVVVAFPAADLLSSIGILKPGDRVDINFSFDFSKARPDIFTGMNTFTALQDVPVAAVVYANADTSKGAGLEGASSSGQFVKQGEPTAILLTMSRQDALLVKYFRDQGCAQDLVLRSPMAEGQVFDVQPIDGDYVLQRLKIRWRVVE